MSLTSPVKVFEAMHRSALNALNRGKVQNWLQLNLRLLCKKPLISSNTFARIGMH